MKKGKIGYLIITSVIVWSAVIIVCSFVLNGTPFEDDVHHILIGGIAFHLFFICGPLLKEYQAIDDKKSKIDNLNFKDSK